MPKRTNQLGGSNHIASRQWGKWTHLLCKPLCYLHWRCSRLLVMRQNYYPYWVYFLFLQRFLLMKPLKKRNEKNICKCYWKQNVGTGDEGGSHFKGEDVKGKIPCSDENCHSHWHLQGVVEAFVRPHWPGIIITKSFQKRWSIKDFESIS